MNDMKKSIRIACVQHRTAAGEIKENLRRYEPGVDEAARKGARLVILPELFSAGYIPNTSSLGYAEKEDGITLEWMRNQSKCHALYLGGGISIIENGQCYNRYYIVSPSGDIEGRAQKKHAEAYCFKRGEGSHLIKTDIGTFAVGICGDNHYSDVASELKNGEADIIIMPHAWPTPKKKNTLPADDSMKLRGELHSFPAEAAVILNKPVVFCNQLGEMAPMQGLLGKIMNPRNFCLDGCSGIFKADGTAIVQAGNGNAVIFADVEPAEPQETGKKIPNYSGMISPGSALLRRIIIPIDIFFGQIAYNRAVKHLR